MFLNPFRLPGLNILGSEPYRPPEADMWRSNARCKPKVYGDDGYVEVQSKLTDGNPLVGESRIRERRGRFHCDPPAFLEDTSQSLTISWKHFGAELLAKERGVKVTGITLSQEQHDLAAQRVQQEGLADQINIEIRDYREVTETYDHVASIEMFEAVGEQLAVVKA